MNIGDKLPDVLGYDQDGNVVKTSDYAGKKIILYFYPKDNTSGCTAEAHSLRDNYPQLRQQGYVVIGVSPDSAASHKGFIEKNDLPFILITDPEHKLAEAMGAWGEKSMYGRKYFGILRTTFITDGEGRITATFLPKQIKTKEHGTQILNLGK